MIEGKRMMLLVSTYYGVVGERGGSGGELLTKDIVIGRPVDWRRSGMVMPALEELSYVSAPV